MLGQMIPIRGDLLGNLCESTTSVLYHILPALITVACGSLLVQRFFVSRSNQSVFIDRFVNELDHIREYSLEYWSLHNKGGDKEEQSILAQRIKGAIKSVGADLQFYCTKYRLSISEKDELVSFLMDISDACTGGEFESSRKSDERNRYLLIGNSINHLRALMFRHKL